MTRDDDFSPATKRQLAARVGHACARPDCRASTSGPQLEADKSVTAGDAAHITAASPNGPRYDPSLSPEERRHYINGIWLCVICARIVDQDKLRYTVAELRRWKEDAEASAQEKLGRPQVSLEHAGAIEQQINAAVVVLGQNAINIVGPVVTNCPSIKGGDVDFSASVTAGVGLDGPGGDVRIEGGAGRMGASGGNVRIGPGHIRAGDGGGGGKGGDIIIKGGDAE